MIELTQEFAFDAAHTLEGGIGKNARLHGHSFRAAVSLRGQPDVARGWLCDLGEVNAAIGKVRDELDHQFLNDLPGLGRPTLENLSRFIYERVQKTLPNVVRVSIYRPSLGQSCIYEPSTGST